MIDKSSFSELVRWCSRGLCWFFFRRRHFPLSLNDNYFKIVLSYTIANRGKDWVLIWRKNDEILFGDPLGLPIRRNTNIFHRNGHAAFGLRETTDKNLQAQSSKNCGLQCIYDVHYIFSCLDRRRRARKLHEIDVIELIHLKLKSIS